MQDLVGGNQGARFKDENRIVQELVNLQDGQDVMAGNDAE